MAINAIRMPKLDPCNAHGVGLPLENPRRLCLVPINTVYNDDRPTGAEKVLSNVKFSILGQIKGYTNVPSHTYTAPTTDIHLFSISVKGV